MQPQLGKKLSKRGLFILIALIALALAVLLYMDAFPTPITLKPWVCANDDADCKDHVFPTKNQVVEYLKNSTVMQRNSDSDYTVAYFGSEKSDHINKITIDEKERLDGHFYKMTFRKINQATHVFTDNGPWWLEDVLVPIQSGSQTVKKNAQVLCQHGNAWVPPPNDYDDVDQGMGGCLVVWNLSGKFVYAVHDKPQPDFDEWRKTASSDQYGLAAIGQGYGVDLSLDYMMADLSPEELATLVKNKEIEMKAKQTDSTTSPRQ